LDAFATHLGRDPLTLAGHSLGGAAVLQYAGVCPERVQKVAAVEGLGPSTTRHEPASLWMRRWLAQLDDFEQRSPRRYASLADAVRRMREVNPNLSAELAEQRAA